MGTPRSGRQPLQLGCGATGRKKQEIVQNWAPFFQVKVWLRFFQVQCLPVDRTRTSKLLYFFHWFPSQEKKENNLHKNCRVKIDLSNGVVWTACLRCLTPGPGLRVSGNTISEQYPLLYSGVVLSQYINAKVVSCGIILIIDFAIFWSSPQRIPSLVIINIIMNPQASGLRSQSSLLSNGDFPRQMDTAIPYTISPRKNADTALQWWKSDSMT